MASTFTKRGSRAPSRKRPLPKDFDFKGSVAPPSKTIQEPLSSEPICLDIERVADDGRGIALHQGKTVFVANALVGERANVVLTKQTHKYDEAKIVTLIDSSAERVEPPCSVFSRCGGCSVQHMPADQQITFKQQAVLSQLKRWGRLTPLRVLLPLVGKPMELIDTLNTLPNTLPDTLTDTANLPQGYGYRRRLRIAVDYNKLGELQFGFREPHSQRIVNINTCLVAEPILQQCIAPLKQWLQQIPANVVSHVECIAADLQPALVIRHTRVIGVEDRQRLEQSLHDTLAQPCDMWFQSQKAGGLSDSRNQAVDPRLSYTLPALPSLTTALILQFHPQDFIQSNRVINEAMVTQAIQLLAPQKHEHIVDLFCGIGNFSLALAQCARQVTGIEGVATMVARATQNAQNNAIDNARFVEADLNVPFRESSQQLTQCFTGDFALIDGLLLDPPRGGAKVICEHINELSPSRIVYVSCDSATFSRDAAILASQGYQLSDVGIMDMFPNTSHVEIMARFDRAKKASKTQKKQGKKPALRLQLR